MSLSVPAEPCFSRLGIARLRVALRPRAGPDKLNVVSVQRLPSGPNLALCHPCDLHFAGRFTED